MTDIIEEIANAFYLGENEKGLELFLQGAGALASIPGIADWINPLFDAVERRDYLYAADLLKYEIEPLG